MTRPEPVSLRQAAHAAYSAPAPQAKIEALVVLELVAMFQNRHLLKPHRSVGASEGLVRIESR